MDIIDLLSESQKTTYSQKLRDPRWQKKRLEILSRDGFKCTKCGDGTTELHVHHLKYSGQPWEVENEFLTTLCADCHDFIETMVSRNEEKPLHITKLKNDYDSIVNVKIYKYNNKINLALYINNGKWNSCEIIPLSLENIEKLHTILTDLKSKLS